MVSTERVGRLLRLGQPPFSTEEHDLLAACATEDLVAAVDLLTTMIEVAADRLQPHGLKTNLERMAFAAGLDEARRADIVMLHARREALRDLIDRRG